MATLVICLQFLMLESGYQYSENIEQTFVIEGDFEAREQEFD